MKTVTRDALAELLRKEGHEIVTGRNGQEPWSYPLLSAHRFGGSEHPGQLAHSLRSGFMRRQS
jgi:hypothetical protein